MEPMLITREGLSAVPAGVQKGTQELRHVEDTLHVETEHALPRRFVVVLQLGSPDRARVVHEDVEVVFTGLDLVGESLALGLGGEVGRQGSARAVLGELLGERVTDLGLARGDIDLGAGIDEAASDHLADAATPAGDQYDLAIDIKERTHLRSVNHGLRTDDVGHYSLVAKATRGRGSSGCRACAITNASSASWASTITCDMPLKGSPQRTRNLTGPTGPELVEDAKVRDGDGHDVGLWSGDVLRVDRPHAVVREVEGALDLALIDPLEVAHDVRVVRARRARRRTCARVPSCHRAKRRR